MKTSRYSEEQIIGFLKQAEAGVQVKKVCRKGGFKDATFPMFYKCVRSTAAWTRGREAAA